MKPIKNLWYPKPIVSFLRATFGVFLRKYYNIEFIDTQNIKNFKGPFIIVSNHVNFWDPFFISSYLIQEIHYITSDNIFRDPLFKYFMKLFGSIPKSKFIPDTQTIRLVLKTIKKGASIGVFPEANRTWDGENMDIVESTGKLIKLSAVPVIGVKIKGAYLSLPRWGEKKRKGKVIIEFNQILKKEEVNSLSYEKINEIISNWIKHSDDQFEETNNIKYSGENLAQYLEQILFICPKCKNLVSIYTEGDHIRCKNCDLDLIYTEYAKIKNQNSISDFEFKNVSSWNKWQIKYFYKFIKDLFEDNVKDDQVILSDVNIDINREINTDINTNINLNTNTDKVTKTANLYIGYRYDKVTFLTEGYVVLKKDNFEIISNKKDKNNYYSFKIEKMEGINVQNKEVLEFYYDNKLYRLFYNDKRASTYKWLIGLLIVKKLILLENEKKNKISKINIETMFKNII